MTDQRDDTPVDTIRNLRREIDNLRVAAERRNRQLDALGIVWCDGGCARGMHRFSPDRDVTPAMIADLVRNAGRAVRWYVNHAGKRAADKQAAWQAARDEIIENVPGPFRAMVEHASKPIPATVYMVQEWGIEHREVLGIYASERTAVEAVRQRLLTHDGWICQGAVYRAHRRRVWRTRRQATAHRWVGARLWLRYQLERTSFRRVCGHAEARPLWVWSTTRATGDGVDYRLGVFVYEVTP